MENYKTNCFPTWCPGCANFTIMTALQNAFLTLNLKPEEIICSYDIGCGANMGNFLRTSAFLGLHGRSVPLAAGVKMVNPDLKVLAIGGDGGQLGEGGNHLIHAARRNDDITVIILNNFFFSLTTGQASPTTPLGTVSKTTPEGSGVLPLDIVNLSLVAGASFVARAFPGKAEHFTGVITKAIKHKGFSVIEVISPCITFSKKYNFAYYLQRVKEINAIGKTVDEAFKCAKIKKDIVPIGIFYRQEREAFHRLMISK